MLTSDLVRTRVSKGQVKPYYLDAGRAEVLEQAAALLAIFDDALASPDAVTRGEVDEAVEEIIGHGTDFLVWRGLAKLLYDRCEFVTDAPLDPVEIRRAVFARAVEHQQASGRQSNGGGLRDHATRRAVLEDAAAALGISAEDCERCLYNDLEARQTLTKFKTLTPDELVARYNLALAQAVLYRASRLVVQFEDVDSNKLRYLFQALKFYRLMHTVRRVSGSPAKGRSRRRAGYELVVDGPASLFSQSRKYGLQMATFLPALVKLPKWQLTAELVEDPKNRGREFVLSSDEGLVSHYKPRGQWVAKEEHWFEERFAALDSGWTLERRGSIVELDDNEVIVADYVLTSPGGQEVFVEIVGFWRLGYLERRIERLVHMANVPFVLVVSERLKSDRDKLAKAPPEVFFFKGVILPDRVLEAAERALERVAAR